MNEQTDPDPSQTQGAYPDPYTPDPALPRSGKDITQDPACCLVHVCVGCTCVCALCALPSWLDSQGCFASPALPILPMEKTCQGHWLMSFTEIRSLSLCLIRDAIVSKLSLVSVSSVPFPQSPALLLLSETLSVFI